MKIAIAVDDLTRLALALPQITEVAAYDGTHLDVPKALGEEITALLAGGELHELALSALRQTLKGEVDKAAELERLKYITPGAGQAMTYQQKIAEAQAFKAATNPQPLDYPILSSEVGITADTLVEVANIVLAAFGQWQQIGAMIESIRLGAKRDIDVAEHEAAARAVADAIVWPSVQVQS
ncbi:hypothetical protein OIV19_06075 [Brucella sp. HL-2]|nr:hypothetical protein [Brucella sp. HL-2]MCV9907186.1 hypothetical protein [Brucella sp. HL-2]